jgi:hypothetical protein
MVVREKTRTKNSQQAQGSAGLRLNKNLITCSTTRAAGLGGSNAAVYDNRVAGNSAIDTSFC